jgi:hypothetical protein
MTAVTNFSRLLKYAPKKLSTEKAGVRSQMKAPLLLKLKRVRAGFLCVCFLALVTGLSGAIYVVAWGDDDYERTSVPTGITNGAAVAAAETSFALLSDGTVIGWGTYNNGIIPLT